MDINQWLVDAAAVPGGAAWPSPEQHAEAQMDPLMVSQLSRQVYIAQIAQCGYAADTEVMLMATPGHWGLGCTLTSEGLCQGLVVATLVSTVQPSLPAYLCSQEAMLHVHVHMRAGGHARQRHTR